MTDAEPDPAKVRADLSGDIANAVVAAVTAAGLDPHLARHEIELVVEDRDIGRIEFVEAHGFADRVARHIHHGQGFERQNTNAADVAGRGRAGKAAAPRPEAVAPHDLIQRHEAEIVAMAGVFRPRIAQSDQEQHGFALCFGLPPDRSFGGARSGRRLARLFRPGHGLRGAVRVASGAKKPG